ncbi:MAG: monovalent cation/H+ antiporter complex subunit F [Deferrisomatales bacterium]|nr:monovalent cation/H+ antiporter complex subunit F [Deferrisomatales bacterium]
MSTFLLVLAGMLAVVLLIPFYRVVEGPTVFDRLLGAGAVGSKTIVIACLFGAIYGRLDMFIDLALAYGVLNFVGLIAIEKYFCSRERRE